MWELGNAMLAVFVGGVGVVVVVVVGGLRSLTCTIRVCSFSES